MKNIRLMYALLFILSLIIGICIYLFFRDINNMLVFGWFPNLKLNIVYFPIKINQSLISNIFIYNIPDMLWFLSGIFLFRFIWFYNLKTQMFYLFCFYVIGFAFEILQLIKIIPGTFDLLDILFLGIGAFVESLLYKNFIKRRIV